MRDILIKLCFLCSILSSLSSEVISLRDGKIYDFAETNAIDYIQIHIKENSKKLEEKLSQIEKKQKEQILNFKPEQKQLYPAKKNKVFYPDTSYTLQKDILDANGKVMYKKGFKFNPADYIKLEKEIVVVDANSPLEYKWLDDNNITHDLNYMILVTNGNALKLSQKMKRPIYYLTKDIAQKFSLAATPSIIKQKENLIEVREICLKNCQ